MCKTDFLGKAGVTVNAVEKWKAGDRHPNNSKAIITLLKILSKRKRVPKKRRYAKNKIRSENE